MTVDGAILLQIVMVTIFCVIMHMIQNIVTPALNFIEYFSFKYLVIFLALSFFFVLISCIDKFSLLILLS